MAQKLVYPGIFDSTVMPDHVEVTVPDVPGVYTLGANNQDAAKKAADLMGPILAKAKGELPVPSAPSELKTKPGQTINFIVFDLDEYK